MTQTPPTLRVHHYTISADLFTLGYPASTGPWACTTECCKEGAYIDLSERDAALAHASAIIRQLDETQPLDPAQWFEPDERTDADFRSGKCIGTAVHRDKCTLQDRVGRCSLQVTAHAAQEPKWSLKPLYCVLFPLEVIAGVLRYDRRYHGKRPCCTAQPNFAVPLFLACREELTHLLGASGFEALERHYTTYYGDGKT